MGAPILTDGQVRLRPWRLIDARWYVVATRDPEIQHWTSERPDLTAAQVRRAIRCVRQCSDRFGYAICDASTGQRLGNVALVIERLGVADVGYWVAAPARGRGTATAALELVSGWALRTFELRALLLWTRRGNLASQQVALRAGFRRAPDRDTRRVVKGESWEVEYFIREPD